VPIGDEGEKVGSVPIVLSSLAGMIPSRVEHMNFNVWEEHRNKEKGTVEDAVSGLPIVAEVKERPESPVPALAGAILGMDKALVSEYIVACNTVHGMLPEVDAHIYEMGLSPKSNRVSIIDELVRSMPGPEKKKIGRKDVAIPMAMMATTTTRQLRLYSNAAERLGRTDLVFVKPALDEKPPAAYGNFQELCDRGVIFDGIKAGNDNTAVDSFLLLLDHLHGEVVDAFFKPDTGAAAGRMQRNLLKSLMPDLITVVGGCSEIELSYQKANEKVNAGKSNENQAPICRFVDSVDFGVARIVANAHSKKHDVDYDPARGLADKREVYLADSKGRSIGRPIEKSAAKKSFGAQILDSTGSYRSSRGNTR
jgi:hypothetical protein